MKEDSDQVGQITRISQSLRKAGHKSNDAVELTELIFNMASANIVSRFESKLESKLDAQNTKYNILIWAIGIGTTLIVASNFFA